MGFKFGGEIDPCSECTEQIPYTALINDGKGNFSANYKIPLYDYWVEFEQKNGFPRSQLWPTTAAIGDFDNDGFGDIALGWFNPEISHLYGFNENSSGVIYLNNGKNDWTQRISSSFLQIILVLMVMQMIWRFLILMMMVSWTLF